LMQHMQKESHRRHTRKSPQSTDKKQSHNGHDRVVSKIRFLMQS
jgi:hypothetical protein